MKEERRLLYLNTLQ